MKKLFAGLAIAATVTGGMLTSTGIASARTTLGNVTLPDVIAWCDTHNARPTDANNPYSWQCTAANSGSPVHGVDMNAVCTRKYGSPAYADLGGARTPYNWYCWR